MTHPLPINLNHWHHYQRNPRLQADPLWRDWLLDRGSLTQRLKAISQGSFAVRKLRQGWLRPTRSEARCLGIPPRQLALVREVELVCHGQPWIFARSVFPLSTLQGRLRHLKNLDARPLGELLFKAPGMRRTRFEVAAINSCQLRGSYPRQRIWARRSLFYLEDKPILVAEFFLPALEKHARQVKSAKL